MAHFVGWNAKVPSSVIIKEQTSKLQTHAGAVYTWGHNQDGQLGLGDYQGQAAPTLVEDKGLESHNVVKVSMISCCCGVLANTSWDVEQLPVLQDACGPSV